MESYKFKGKVTVYEVRSSDGLYHEGQLAPGVVVRGTDVEQNVTVFRNDPAVAALAIFAKAAIERHCENDALRDSAGLRRALRGLQLGQVKLGPAELLSTEVVAPPPKWPVQRGTKVTPHTPSKDVLAGETAEGHGIEGNAHKKVGDDNAGQADASSHGGPATNPEASTDEATNPEATNPDAPNPDATNPDATNPDATNPVSKPGQAKRAGRGAQQKKRSKAR